MLPLYFLTSLFPSLPSCLTSLNHSSPSIPLSFPSFSPSFHLTPPLPSHHFNHSSLLFLDLHPSSILSLLMYDPPDIPSTILFPPSLSVSYLYIAIFLNYSSALLFFLPLSTSPEILFPFLTPSLLLPFPVLHFFLIPFVLHPYNPYFLSCSPPFHHPSILSFTLSPFFNNLSISSR